MSQENVEVVRRTLEAWQRDDLPAWLSELDPDVEWHTAAQRFVEGAGSAYRGIDGMRELWTFWRTEAADFRFETQELRDLGDDGVLHLAHLRWRGRASGVEVQSPLGQVITVRDGNFVRSVDYLSHADALEAVGLGEQAEPQSNLEVARTWIEAYNRFNLEALLAVTHPDFEFRTSGAFPGLDPVYRGHVGFRSFYEDFTATWDSFTVAVHELREVGQRALLLGMFEGRGRDGVEVRRQTASVWTFRDRLVFRIWNYEGWPQALKAVGGPGPTPLL